MHLNQLRETVQLHFIRVLEFGSHTLVEQRHHCIGELLKLTIDAFLGCGEHRWVHVFETFNPLVDRLIVATMTSLAPAIRSAGVDIVLCTYATEGTNKLALRRSIPGWR